MTKHKSKYARNRIKKSTSKENIPIIKSEKLLCREYTNEQREKLLSPENHPAQDLWVRQDLQV